MPGLLTRALIMIVLGPRVKASRRRVAAQPGCPPASMRISWAIARRKAMTVPQRKKSAPFFIDGTL